MPIKSKISRNAKQCVTCEYWTGRSIEADSPNFIKCDPKERANAIKQDLSKPFGIPAINIRKNIIFNSLKALTN